MYLFITDDCGSFSYWLTAYIRRQNVLFCYCMHILYARKDGRRQTEKDIEFLTKTVTTYIFRTFSVYNMWFVWLLICISPTILPPYPELDNNTKTFRFPINQLNCPHIETLLVPKSNKCATYYVYIYI